ncbi:MAG: hypothetical protein ACOCQD_01390, partial [archaeon]
GILDEIRIWDGKTFEAESGNINRIVDHNDPALVGYYKMDTGSGDVLIDSSNKSNDGELFDIEWVSGVIDMIPRHRTLLKSKSNVYTYTGEGYKETEDYQNDGMLDLTPLLNLTDTHQIFMNYDYKDSDGHIYRKNINKKLLNSIKSSKFIFNL